MLRKQAIVLCAFANDLHRPLQLEAEEKAIGQCLAVAEDAERLSFRPLHGASLDDLYKNFNRFHNRIHIFHFAGHSNGTFLNLEDTQARASNLSVLMGMQKNLKLVFLNGCSNKAQVAELAKQGVKAIIATSAPIEDESSIEFAKTFYDALANGKNIQESFNTAKSKIQNDQPQLEIVQRGLVLRPSDPEQLPWGLFAEDSADLDWTLPDPFEVPTDINFHQEVSLNNNQVNKKLVEEIFQGLIPLKSRHRRLWEEYSDPEEDEVNLIDLQEVIYKHFPSILSIQIRDLFTDSVMAEGRKRLREINEVYLILSKLLCAIALADLWRIVLLEDEATGQFSLKEDVKIRCIYRKELLEYAQLNKAQSAQYDYVWLLSTIYRIFEDNQHEPYLEEIKGLQKTLFQSEVYDAYHFMEFEIKQRLQANNIASEEVAALCKTAEQQLGTLLRHCAFLTQYQLVSINDIQVSKPLLQSKADFIHKKAILKGNESTLWDQRPQSRKNYACNHAVVITPNIQEEQAPLTLSPFIIDENVLKKVSNRNPKIHIWAGHTEDNRLHYQHAEIMQDAFLIPPKKLLDKYEATGLEQVQTLWNTFVEHLQKLECHD